MKKLGSILFLTTLCRMLCAQTSVFPAGMAWKYLHENLCEEGWVRKTVEITMGSSEVTDGKTYTLIGNFRVYTDDNKVYVLQQKTLEGNQTKDTLVLLYDFGLQTGDRLNWIESHGEVIPENMTDDTNGSLLREASVTSVETITLADGRSARRIHYDNRADDIEFVGSVNGVFAPLGLPVATCVKETFLCCSTADGLLFETSKGACESAVTVLDGINAGNVVRKVLENGSLFILYNGKRYSILGTESE